MIASIVATIEPAVFLLEHSDQQIKLRNEFEMGVINESRLPMTVEAADADSLETATRWLMTLGGIVNVDVVLVHFDP